MRHSTEELCWHNCLALSFIPPSSPQRQRGWGGPGPCLAPSFISTEAEEVWKGLDLAWPLPLTLPSSLHPSNGHATTSLTWGSSGWLPAAPSPCFFWLRQCGKSAVLLSVPGQVACERTLRITSLGALLMTGSSQALEPAALPVITNTAAMADQFSNVCEFFQILPEAHSILWIPTGAPMLHALEKRLSTWWEHS